MKNGQLNKIIFIFVICGQKIIGSNNSPVFQYTFNMIQVKCTYCHECSCFK